MTTKWLASLLSALAFTTVTLLGAIPAPALAQDGAPPPGASDQQGSGSTSGPDVARVSVVQGKVIVQRGDSNTQAKAAVNAPLLPGDYVSTGPNGRSEVQFDGYTAVRLGGGVQARITANDANSRELQLADGTIEVSILHDDGPIDVETPSVTVRAQNRGAYRITIGSDGATWVTARRGTVSVITPQHTYDLQPGKTMVARGSASSPSIAYTAEVGYDSFDKFNAQRDRVQLAAIQSDQNLNPDVAGYDNLNAYGQWQNVSGYGNVWVPNEPAGWAPYRDGSWAWEGGYGWTWVGSEPWGWVPYHYGRWFYDNSYGWCWYPPPYAVAPVWQPALVGFFGFGFGGPGWGIGVGFGFGSIGWVPLAPYEPFYPWYPGWSWYGGWGHGYWGWNHGWGGWGTHVTNITNITNIHNVYRNFYHGGASGTLASNFRDGHFGHVTAVNVSKNLHVGSIRGALPVTPTRNNLGFGSGKAVGHFTNLSKSFSSARFAANGNAAHRTSFDEQQRIVSQKLNDHPVSHENAPVTGRATGSLNGRQNAPVNVRENAPVKVRENAVNARENAPVKVRENAPVNARENAPVRVRENAPVKAPENAAPRTNASDPWQRFDAERGSAAGHFAEPARNGGAAGRAAPPERNSISPERAAQFTRTINSNDAARSDAMRAPAASGSWGRFSQERGSVRAPEAPHSAYSSYGRGSYQGYSRGSYPGEARGSFPAESRGSYQGYSRGSYPDYSRGSYPSYSRGSYPSYSRGSYPSAPRESAPSYPRGGSYSAPHASGGGGWSHAGGGGGGGWSHAGGGGGGGRSGGGGRPPHA